MDSNLIRATCFRLTINERRSIGKPLKHNKLSQRFQPILVNEDCKAKAIANSRICTLTKTATAKSQSEKKHD